MDYTPRKIIAMVRSGFKNEVLTTGLFGFVLPATTAPLSVQKALKSQR